MVVLLNAEPRRIDGSSVVDGIAIGRAIRWAADPSPRGRAGTRDEERSRLERALSLASGGVQTLLDGLAPPEAELFLPELAMLAELGPLLLERVARGATAEDAIDDATSALATDLLVDARARLLDGLGSDPRSVEELLDGREGDRILVTATLTPSVVAVLPRRVVGIVAAHDGAMQRDGQYTSHAVILARGRSIPLAFVPSDVVHTLVDDDLMIIDTRATVASLWSRPDDIVVAAAEDKRAELLLERAREEERVAARLLHLGVEVRVNVGSIYERIPQSAEGIGLLRTELVFSAHSTAPSEAEQLGALATIAGQAGCGPVVVRLFDAGGDKALAWLRAPSSQPHARGIALLLLHPGVLASQVRAIVRAGEHVGVRILLPLVGCAFEVEHIRTLSHRQVSVGAMIETPAAVDDIDALAVAADFICIGTNDLFAMLSGGDREDPSSYDVRGLRMIARVIEVAHAHAREVSVCGEMAGDPEGAQILVGLGVDAISVATTRFARVKLSLRDVSLEQCRGAARRALSS